MNYVSSVSKRAVDIGRSRPTRALVSVITTGIFEAFAATVHASIPARVWIVSPWLSEPGSTGFFDSLLRHVERHKGRLVVITRRASTEAHAALLERFLKSNRIDLHIHPSVHAKLFICESRFRDSFALIGSANLTAGSTHLEEVAMLVRGSGRSDPVRNLIAAATKLRSESLRAVPNRVERSEHDSLP